MFKLFCRERANISFLLLLGLILFSGAARASDTYLTLSNGNIWTLYAFGNAQALADTLRAVSNFTASSVFSSLVSFVAITGAIVLALKEGTNPSIGKKFVGYCVGLLLITYTFFGWGGSGRLVISLEVKDTVDQTWIAPITVPAPIGIPASVISTIGQKLTEQIEASFFTGYPSMRMSAGAPFNLAAAIISDSAQARITDANFGSSLAYYVQDCFTLGVADGTLSANTIVTSTDFLKEIKYTNNFVFVNTFINDVAPGVIGEADLVSCPEAHALIEKFVKDKKMEDLLKSASAWSRTPATSVLTSVTDSVMQWSTNNGINSGGTFVKQAAVLNAFKQSQSQVAAATGNNEQLTAYGLAQAKESQYNGWVTGAEVFNRSMGYVLALLQVFVYGVMPLVLVAALIPGLGIKLFSNFSQILLWLTIVTPMLAIVNFIILSMQMADLGGLLGLSTTTPVPVANKDTPGLGISLSSMGIITEKTANMRAAGSFIGTMVPALAWAMVKGAMDFSKVIGSAVGEQFANQAANTATTGSYNLNSASMDSFSANKHSIAAVSTFNGGSVNGGGPITAKNDHGITQETGAGTKVAQGLAISHAGSVAQAKATVDSAATTKASADATGVSAVGSLTANTSLAQNSSALRTAAANIGASAGGSVGGGKGGDTISGTAPSKPAAPLSSKAKEGLALTTKLDTAEAALADALKSKDQSKIAAAKLGVTKAADAEATFINKNPDAVNEIKAAGASGLPTGSAAPSTINKNLGANGGISGGINASNGDAESRSQANAFVQSYQKSLTVTTGANTGIQATSSTTGSGTLAATGTTSWNTQTESFKAWVLQSIRGRQATEQMTHSGNFRAGGSNSMYVDPIDRMGNTAAKIAEDRQDIVNKVAEVTSGANGTITDAERENKNDKSTIKAKMAKIDRDFDTINAQGVGTRAAGVAATAIVEMARDMPLAAGKYLAEKAGIAHLYSDENLEKLGSAFGNSKDAVSKFAGALKDGGANGAATMAGVLKDLVPPSLGGSGGNAPEKK